MKNDKLVSLILVATLLAAFIAIAASLAYSIANPHEGVIMAPGAPGVDYSHQELL